METKRRHASENLTKDRDAVQALELRLAVVNRWQIGDPEFQEAGKLVSMRKYQRRLDVLEGLVVARIFELTKMNRSHTGKKPARTSHQLLTASLQVMRFGNTLVTLCKSVPPPFAQR